ncbi:MAG: WD40 repeat domain-containing protein [Planctomycetaceae bacterium]|nr:WD40 repeat domain-containing protein [Planctomycetaceae bacterium]
MRWVSVRILPLLLALAADSKAITAAEAPAERQYPATALTCSADGRWLVTVGESELCVHDAKSLAVVQRVVLPMPTSCDVRFLSGEQVIVAGGTPGESGALVLLQAAEVQPLQLKTVQRIVVGSDVLSAVARGAEELVAGGFDRALHRRLMTEHGAAEKITAAHSKPITDVVSDPGQELLISSGADNTIRVWNIQSLKQERALNNHARAVRGVALRPQQDTTALPLLASAADDRTVRFWQPTIGRMVRFKRLKSPATCVTWLDDGSRAVVGCRDGHVCLVDPVRLSLTRISVSQSGWVTCVAAVPGTVSVIAGATDGALRRMSATDAVD